MKFRFLILFVFLTNHVLGQSEIQKENRILPAVLQIDDNKDWTIENAKKQLLNKYNVEKNTELRQYRKEKDQLGFEHLRFHQYFKNILVEGSMYLIHFKENGKAYMANGEAYAIKSAHHQASISEALALSKSLQYVNATAYYWEQDVVNIPDHHNQYKSTPKGELVWAPVDGDFTKADFQLCYKFDIYSIKPYARTLVYVSAHTGKIVWSQDGIHETNVNGTTVTKYSGTRTFQTDSTATNSFRLRDNSRGNGVRTFDKNNGTSTAAAVDFTDADNYWNNANANQDEVAGDVHWGTQKVYDYFLNTFGRNSYDGNGALLPSYVHHGNNYVNAFWDGSSMHYGDGNSSTTALTCLDVVGHELTHGVTNFSANLIYSYESGALNESFSDIFGKTIEFIEKPSTATWILAKEITTSGNGFRNMANPNAKGDPDTYLGTNWHTSSSDNGGVHTNSGVQNFWYYVLVNGDTSVNDNNDAYSVSGIGMTKASAIAYRNLTTYLTSNSQYADARYFAIQAAKDLYGGCSNEMIQTTNAWYAVGVGPEYDTTVTASFTATPTASCTVPVSVQFNSTSTNAASAVWDFGDGGSSSVLNPVHTYNQLGQFTVKLIVTGCNNNVDSIIQVNYIDIDSNSVFCDTTQMGTSGTITITDCAGVIVDDGGAYGKYSNNKTSYIRVLSPPMVSHYELEFVQFSFENNYDYLRLYDGYNTSATTIGNYTGYNLPNNGNLISTSDSLFFMRFKSDQYLNDDGFILKYKCVYNPTTADFYSADTVSCTGVVSFTNTSQSASSYYWDFGDGNNSTLTNPVHTYAAPGVYAVSLVAINGTATDTILKSSYINYNPNLPLCNATPIPINSNTTITDCAGLIVDNGGAYANYSNNVNGSVLLSTSSASFYRMKFNQFNTQASNDVITIYDGPNSSSAILGQFSGTSLPNAGNYINSSSPNVFITFTTNSSVIADGFQLEYECGYYPSSASFYSVDTVSCDSSIQFTNTSTNALSYLWNFGDGTTDTATNPLHNYNAPGTYTITLIACNPQYCDTTVSQNYVSINPNTLACNTFLQPVTGVQQISNVCYGLLLDNGGANNNYSANINNSQTVITGQANQQIKLNFLDYDLVAGDKIRIYDGTSSADPILAELSNYPSNILPNNGQNIWSTSNQIMIEFYSDAAVESDGFELLWTCALRNDSLNFALLDVDSINYCKNIFEFEQSNVIPTGITTFDLFTGDGNNISVLNPAQYTYPINGNYQLKLELSDGINSYYEYESLITNQVFANATIPTSAFPGQQFNLIDNSVNGGNSIWIINGAQQGTGSPFATSINQLGVQTIQLVASNNHCSDTFTQQMNIVFPDGINENNLIKGVHVYPNPARNQFVIKSKNFSIQNVALFDPTGKMIYKNNIDSKLHEVSTAHIANGIYMLRLEFKNGDHLMQKIVIKK